MLQTQGELAKTGSPPQISSATFPAASFTSAFKILEQSMPATIAHGLGGSNARGTVRWALVPRRPGDPRRADRPGGAPVAAAPTRPPAAKMPPPHASACDSATGSRDQDGGGTDGGRHHPTPPRPRPPAPGRPAVRHHGAAGAPVHGRGTGAWRRSAVHAKRGASVPTWRRVGAIAVRRGRAVGRRHGQVPSTCPRPPVGWATPPRRSPRTRTIGGRIGLPTLAAAGTASGPPLGGAHRRILAPELRNLRLVPLGDPGAHFARAGRAAGTVVGDVAANAALGVTEEHRRLCLGGLFRLVAHPLNGLCPRDEFFQDALGVVVAVCDLIGLDLVDDLFRLLDGRLYGVVVPIISTVRAIVRW